MFHFRIILHNLILDSGKFIVITVALGLQQLAAVGGRRPLKRLHGKIAVKIVKLIKTAPFQSNFLIVGTNQTGILRHIVKQSVANLILLQQGNFNPFFILNVGIA